MKREPHHFTYADFGKAMFGSFIVGLTFLFRDSMMYYSDKMGGSNVVVILVITFLLVSLEIYFLSYRFVVNRQTRPFYEFWAKRFFSIVISSFITVYLTMYLYGLNNYLTQKQMLKLTSAIFMPAAIIGAGIEILKKK